MRRKISLFLASILCLSMASAALAATFTDVHSSDYCYTPVLWAVENGVTSGTSASAFSPNDTCTVGQILTFLWRASGQPAPTSPNPFTDVTEKDYFASAACWASEQGLVSGPVLNASAPCTRSMVVTYLWKLSGGAQSGAASFADVPADADYAPAVAWAVEKGITSGTSATAFSPDQACTRGQIVTFLYRYSGSPEVEVPQESAFYASYPDAPDFGAFLGVPLTDSKVKDSACYYYYSLADVQANSNASDAVDAYVAALESNGFNYSSTTETSDGPFIYFISSKTYVAVGVKDGTVCILVRPLKDLMDAASEDGKHYNECPDVPDFGLMAGILPVDASQRANGWTYTYSGEAATEANAKAYVQLLADDGFQLIDAADNGYGSMFLIYSNGRTEVWFGEAMGGVMVAVYN